MREELKYIFANVNDWLKFSEAKHGALIAFNSAVIFGIFQIVETLENSDLYYKIAFILTIISLAIAILVSLYSFIPITKPKTECICKNDFNRKKEGLNVLFYNDIHNLSSHQLIELLNFNLCTNSEPNGFDCNLAHQIINNARITSKKFFLFKISGNLTWIGIFLFVILVLLKYVFIFLFSLFV